MSDTKSEASSYGWQDFKGTVNEWAWWWLEFHFLHHAKADDDIETEEFCRQLMITKAKHERVLQMLEIAKTALEKYQGLCIHWNVNHHETCGRLADEALAQIKELKK